MVKEAILLIFLLSAVGLAQAETVEYVTDQLEITLRSGKSTKHEILRMVPSGARLVVLEADRDSGYSRVRTSSGKEGWVLSRYLMDEPPARIRLADAEKKTADLQATVSQLQQELTDVKTAKTAAEQERDQLKSQTSKLSRDLAEIRKVSANAVSIAQENRTLEKRAADIDRENQLLRQENESLKDRSKRDWFVVGAIVVVCSMLFGILLTRIRWQRRSSWGEL